MSTSYEIAIDHLDVIKSRVAEEEERHEAAIRELNQELGNALKLVHTFEVGGHLVGEAYQVARGIVRIEWGRDRKVTPEVMGCFNDAIEDLRHGGARLRREYFGVKSYEGWSSQRVNCAYGMGPSHGTVWFRINRRDVAAELTPSEVLAAVQWLTAVRNNPGLLG